MKKSLIAGVLSLGLLAGCLGPNKAFNGLYDWTETATDNRWLNEAIHVAFVIIPVYGVGYLLDIIIFNSIEWWGGDNPID